MTADREALAAALEDVEEAIASVRRALASEPDATSPADRLERLETETLPALERLAAANQAAVVATRATVASVRADVVDEEVAEATASGLDGTEQGASETAPSTDAEAVDRAIETLRDALEGDDADRTDSTGGDDGPASDLLEDVRDLRQKIQRETDAASDRVRGEANGRDDGDVTSTRGGDATRDRDDGSDSASNGRTAIPIDDGSDTANGRERAEDSNGPDVDADGGGEAGNSNRATDEPGGETGNEPNGETEDADEASEPPIDVEAELETIKREAKAAQERTPSWTSDGADDSVDEADTDDSVDEADTDDSVDEADSDDTVAETSNDDTKEDDTQEDGGSADGAE